MKARNKLLAVALLIVGAVAIAATKGDQSPYGAYGVVQVNKYDGGAGAPSCIGLPNQNSLMVRNWINDAGTASTAYCGFNTSVTILTGMPLQSAETLTVDVVALTQNGAFVATPGLNDGGVTITAGTLSPKLCCVVKDSTSPTDLHYMIVK